MRLLIALPFLLLLVLFALSNEQDVVLRLWPTDFELDAPLSAAIIAGMAVAFLLGALTTWGASLGSRRRARQLERTRRRLEEELAGLRARNSGVKALPPPA